MTLAALMARQKEIAARQQGVLQQGASNIPQGLSQLAWTLVDALQQRRNERELAQGQADVAGAFGRMNPATGELPPEAVQTLAARAPDVAVDYYQQAMNARRQSTQWQAEQQAKVAEAAQAHKYRLEEQTAGRENWTTLSPEEITQLGLDASKGPYQRNATTGKISQVGAGGVTIQNVPAEVAGRIGMGDQFLKNYDNVIKEVNAGNLTGLNYGYAVTLGRGTGGEAYRQIQSGVDALRRFLTGAGISQSEAQDYADRYMPVWHNDAKTVSDKLKGLYNDILAVREAVAQGRNVQSVEELGLTKRPDETPPEGATPPGTTAPPAAGTQAPTAPAAAAAPVPTSASQIKPGVTYTFPNGQTGSWSGQGDVRDKVNWSIGGG
jgi:hypothetical protein